VRSLRRLRNATGRATCASAELRRNETSHCLLTEDAPPLAGASSQVRPAPDTSDRPQSSPSSSPGRPAQGRTAGLDDELRERLCAPRLGRAQGNVTRAAEMAGVRPTVPPETACAAWNRGERCGGRGRRVVARSRMSVRGATLRVQARSAPAERGDPMRLSLVLPCCRRSRSPSRGVRRPPRRRARTRHRRTRGANSNPRTPWSAPAASIAR